MSKKLFITAALACCFVVCLAIAIADVSGKWSGNIIGPDGKEITLTYDIKVEGDKLTGTGGSDANTVDIYDGKIAGNDITFKVTNTDGVVIPHKGRYYAEGDSIGMDIDFNSMKFHCKLKRDK